MEMRVTDLGEGTEQVVFSLILEECRCPGHWWGGGGALKADRIQARTQRQERAPQFENCISNELSLQEQWEITEDALRNKNSS